MDVTPRFTKASRWRQGYLPEQVDEFCDRIERDLAARRSGRDGQFTGADIVAVQFDSAYGGYDMDEVDAYLDRAEAEIETGDPAASPPRTAPPPPSGGTVSTMVPATATPTAPGEANRPADWSALLRERSDLLRIMREPAGGRFPRCGLMGRGYRPEDVDGFVDRVAAAIRTIRPEEVRDMRFGAVLRGYDEQVVDGWMERLAAHVEASGGR